MLFDTIVEWAQNLPKTIRAAAWRLATRAKLAAAIVAETLTGRCCEKCDHYAKGSCWHPDFKTRDECMTSLRPVGYKKRPPATSAKLSAEEQHQLQKIKAALQEAGDTARESGLLGE